MSKGKIGIWMYRNAGGIEPQQELVARLRDLGYEVINDFDMRKCYCLDNRIITEDGRDLTTLDLLFHMNADERTPHQNSILQTFALAGVHVINPVTAYEQARDKFLSNFLLRRSGIRVPQSILINNDFPESILKGIFAEWKSVLLKPRKWFGGRGIIKFDAFAQFMDFYIATRQFYTEFFLQRYIPFLERDYRVELINGEVASYYSRKKQHAYKTNVHAGGQVIPCKYDKNKVVLAKRAAMALSIPVTIVDLIESTEDGEVYVLEVNDCLGVFNEAYGRDCGLDVSALPHHDEQKLNLLVAYLDSQMKKLNKDL